MALESPQRHPQIVLHRASVVSAEALGHFQGLPDPELGRYMYSFHICTAFIYVHTAHLGICSIGTLTAARMA